MDAISLLANACIDSERLDAETTSASGAGSGNTPSSRAYTHSSTGGASCNAGATAAASVVIGSTPLRIEVADLDGCGSSRGKDSCASPPSSAKSLSARSVGGTRGNWTPSEDDLLRKAVEQYGGKNWKKVAETIPDRTDVQCLHRWQKVLRPGLIKGPWTPEEDSRVIDLVAQYGVKSWSFIAKQLQGRLGKQCRERWYNHLSPDIVKAPWTEEEDRLIVEGHHIHGTKWAEIARKLRGRTDNAIKNRWNSTLIRMNKVLSADSLTVVALTTPEKPSRRKYGTGGSSGGSGTGGSAGGAPGTGVGAGTAGGGGGSSGGREGVNGSRSSGPGSGRSRGNRVMGTTSYVSALTGITETEVEHANTSSSSSSSSSASSSPYIAGAGKAGAVLHRAKSESTGSSRAAASSSAGKNAAAGGAAGGGGAFAGVYSSTLRAASVGKGGGCRAAGEFISGADDGYDISTALPSPNARREGRFPLIPAGCTSSGSSNSSSSNSSSRSSFASNAVKFSSASPDLSRVRNHQAPPPHTGPGARPSGLLSVDPAVTLRSVYQYLSYQQQQTAVLSVKQGPGNAALGVAARNHTRAKTENMPTHGMRADSTPDEVRQIIGNLVLSLEAVASMNQNPLIFTSVFPLKGAISGQSGQSSGLGAVKPELYKSENDGQTYNNRNISKLDVLSQVLFGGDGGSSENACLVGSVAAGAAASTPSKRGSSKGRGGSGAADGPGSNSKKKKQSDDELSTTLISMASAKYSSVSSVPSLAATALGGTRADTALRDKTPGGSSRKRKRKADDPNAESVELSVSAAADNTTAASASVSTPARGRKKVSVPDSSQNQAINEEKEGASACIPKRARKLPGPTAATARKRARTAQNSASSSDHRDDVTTEEDAENAAAMAAFMIGSLRTVYVSDTEKDSLSTDGDLTPSGVKGGTSVNAAANAGLVGLGLGLGVEGRAGTGPGVSSLPRIEEGSSPAFDGSGASALISDLAAAARESTTSGGEGLQVFGKALRLLPFISAKRNPRVEEEEEEKQNLTIDGRVSERPQQEDSCAHDNESDSNLTLADRATSAEAVGRMIAGNRGQARSDTLEGEGEAGEGAAGQPERKKRKASSDGSIICSSSARKKSGNAVGYDGSSAPFAEEAPSSVSYSPASSIPSPSKLSVGASKAAPTPPPSNAAYTSYASSGSSGSPARMSTSSVDHNYEKCGDSTSAPGSIVGRAFATTATRAVKDCGDKGNMQEPAGTAISQRVKERVKDTGNQREGESGKGKGKLLSSTAAFDYDASFMCVSASPTLHLPCQPELHSGSLWGKGAAKRGCDVPDPCLQNSVRGESRNGVLNDDGKCENKGFVEEEGDGEGEAEDVEGEGGEADTTTTESTNGSQSERQGQGSQECEWN